MTMLHHTSELPPARPTAAVALAAAMQAVGGGLGWSLVPPLLPDLARDLGVTHAMGGVVWGAAPLGIALASPFGGAAVDRFGPRRVAAAAMVVGALACASRALCTGPWSLAASMLLFGAHVGFVAPSIPKALAGHVPAARFGRANGVALLSYTLATAATVLLARPVLAPLAGGWRGAMVLAGVAMLAVAALWAVAMRDRTPPMPHAGLGDTLALGRLPALRRVAAMHFLLFGGYLALLGILPRALIEAGLPPARAGLAVASWLTVAGIANYAGPRLAERLGRKRPVLIGGAIVAGVALSALALVPSSPILLLMIAALGGGSVAPLLMAAPAEMKEIGPARVGAAMGFLLLVGQAGGFLLPVLAGAVAGRAGLSVALGVLGLAHLAIALPAALHDRAASPSTSPSGALAR